MTNNELSVEQRDLFGYIDFLLKILDDERKVHIRELSERRVEELYDIDFSLRYKSMGDFSAFYKKYVEFSHSVEDVRSKHGDFNLWRSIEREIEVAVFNVYDDWFKFWAMYEIYNIKTRYLNEEDDLDLTVLSKKNLEENESKYFGGLVENVEKYEDLVRICGFKYAVKLSDAISILVLENLVLQEKWYELLYEMEDVGLGCYYVLKYENGIESSVVSFARVKDKKDINSWSSFGEFFQSTRWEIRLDENNKDSKEKYFCGNLRDFSQLVKKSNCVKSFDDLFINNGGFHDGKICEVTRLTVGSTKMSRTFLLYLMNKRLISALVEQGYELAARIIDQRSMLNYHHDKDVYIKYAYNKEINCWRGFWKLDRLSIELERETKESYLEQIEGRLS